MTDAPLEGMRRLAMLTERLAARASLSADEARDAHQEIETTRQGIEQLIRRFGEQAVSFGITSIQVMMNALPLRTPRRFSRPQICLCLCG